MSYIIKNRRLVAKTERTLTSGVQVLFSSRATKECIDANRDQNLVNPQTGYISNAVKWDSIYLKSDAILATEINPGEFLI